MKVELLDGLKSDFIFRGKNAKIEPYENYSVISDLDQPYSYFANFILFENPPENKIKAEKLFDQHFGDHPEIKHKLIYWQNKKVSEKIAQEFLNCNYIFESITTLSMTPDNLKTVNKKLNKNYIIRKFNSHNDWEKWRELEFLEVAYDYEKEAYEKYIDKKIENYQNLIAQNKGFWIGVFNDDELIANMGLFFKDNLARFQMVRTKKAYRNQGICANLLYYTAKLGFEKANKLLIVADTNDIAINIYKRLGFKEEETSYNFQLWEKN